MEAKAQLIRETLEAIRKSPLPTYTTSSIWHPEHHDHSRSISALQDILEHLDQVAQLEPSDGWLQHILATEAGISALKRREGLRTLLAVWRGEKEDMRERIIQIDEDRLAQGKGTYALAQQEALEDIFSKLVSYVRSTAANAPRCISSPDENTYLRFAKDHVLRGHRNFFAAGGYPENRGPPDCTNAMFDAKAYWPFDGILRGNKTTLILSHGIGTEEWSTLEIDSVARSDFTWIKGWPEPRSWLSGARYCVRISFPALDRNGRPGATVFFFAAALEARAVIEPVLGSTGLLLELLKTGFPQEFLEYFSPWLKSTHRIVATMRA